MPKKIHTPLHSEEKAVAPSPMPKPKQPEPMPNSQEKRNLRNFDLTGKRFGRLVVTSLSHSVASLKYWNCVCDCGKNKTIRGAHMTHGKIMSCGCLASDLTAARNFKHGLTSNGAKPRLFIIWSGMKQRCFNSKQPAFKDYGGRGVTICERWKDFKNFAADIGEIPIGMSLDRIDNNGNYCPENCRIATQKQQANNTRANRIVELEGVKLTLSQAAEFSPVSYKAFHARLADGWSIKKAVTQKLRAKKCES